MHNLQSIQQQILSAVYDEAALVAASELLHDSDTLAAASHVSIYRDSIRLGLTQALREIYPVCARLLGDACFEHACDQFIQTHPSRSPDLNRYGLTFPTFISRHELAHQLPYLPDIVRLEYAWHSVFSGPDAVGFDLQSLAELTEQQCLRARIQLQANMQPIESKWPIDKIWHANRMLKDEVETIELTEQSVYLLIWRDGIDMHLDVLAADSWYLLQKLQAGEILSHACELLEQHYPSSDFSSLFGQIAINNWIAGVFLG